MRDSQHAKSPTEVSHRGPGSWVRFGSVWVRLGPFGVWGGLRADRDVVDAKEIRKLRVFLSFFTEIFTSPLIVLPSVVSGTNRSAFLSYIYIPEYIVRLSRAPIDTLPSLSRSQTHCSLSIIAL